MYMTVIYTVICQKVQEKYSIYSNVPVTNYNYIIIKYLSI